MGNSARKYVDLISRVSGKYANWDPPKVMEVGDWGYMDKKSASFVKEGNIFEDPECMDVLEGSEKLVRYGSPEDHVRYTAYAKASLGNDLGASIGATGEMGIKIQGSWDFNAKNRGAVLTATDAYLVYLQQGVVLPKLTKIKKLEGKAIVVETLNCPAYALLLTDKGRGGTASITLTTHISEAGATLGNVVGARWETKSESGVWRTASGYRANLGKDLVYTPLYVLKTTTRRKWSFYRGSPPTGSRGASVVEYEDYDLPWKKLDDEGEEIGADDDDDDILDTPNSPEF